MFRHSFAFALPVASERTEMRCKKGFYSREMENRLCTTIPAQVIPDSFCILYSDFRDEVAVVNA